MSKDNKDMYQTGWMVTPTATFGGSKLDHKIKETEELARWIDEWAKGEDTNEWTKPNIVLLYLKSQERGFQLKVSLTPCLYLLRNWIIA